MPNLSQIKRKRMLEFLEKIKEEHKNDDEMLIALGEIESELNAKKYGLVWEEHEEKVDVQMRTHIPVFTEVKEREISAAPEKPYNFLLEGDNLHSLYLLEKTHKGAIDLIYIDPPYNTGNKDFVYDDSFVDSTDGFKHSKWLSFMATRLNIAKNLLSREGAIFISIDSNEYAQLKMLCDDIFDESNYIGTLIWRKKTGGGQTDDFFVTEHEYVLGYRKSSEFKWIEYQDEANIEDFKYSDTKGRYTIVKLEKWGSSAHKEDRPTMYFSIIDPDGNDFFPVAPDGKDGRWRVGADRLNRLVANNQIHWNKDKKTNKWIPYEKVYYDKSKGKLLKSRSILYDLAETGTATKLLTNIFQQKDIFNNPKPVELLRFLILHIQPKIVLDFFAGSGTTAQAVLEDNLEDNDKIKFILCTNNESQICDNVTYPRIKTVITGKRADGSSYSDGIPANLKYYRTDFVPRDEEYLSDALLEHIAEMIQLEHGVKIDGSQYRMIMSDAEADLFFQNAEEIATVKALYISKNVLLTTEQREKLNGAEIHIIPDDYFLFELKEEAHV